MQILHFFLMHTNHNFGGGLYQRRARLFSCSKRSNIPPIEENQPFACSTFIWKSLLAMVMSCNRVTTMNTQPNNCAYMYKDEYFNSTRAVEGSSVNEFL